MRLDLSHIRQPETAFLRQYEPAAFGEVDEDYRIEAPVSLGMTIHKDQDRFRMVGTVTTTLALACSRCLDPFTVPVHAKFDLRFWPQAVAADTDATDTDAPIDDDDVSMTFYRDEEIDLAGLMREQFYLALPMKPLCRAACLGLCGQCGVRLNVETCRCEPQRDEPRLAGLKALILDRKHDDA